MYIPFVDLKKQYLSIKEEIDYAIKQVIDRTMFIGGEYVKNFESEFAKLYGVKHCIGVANGTDAIYISLKMLGIGYGDEVITVANTWISTAETITQAGGKPVFVDIEDNYRNIDTDKIEEKITKNTKAIIAVHLYGQAAEMNKILDICKKYGLYLIEDCAQSHLTEYRGKYVGLFGDIATFSFYPGKNLGAYGDAGCIITNNDYLAERCRMYANHGALVKHQHKIEGINSRLDSIQAAILLAKLPYLKKWTELRIKNANIYNKELQGIEQLAIPEVRPDTIHTYHVYCVTVEDRTNLQKYLKEKGIETAIHYPTPLPFLESYSYLGYKEKDFPISNKLKNKILSLPMYPELEEEEIAYIGNKIREFYNIKNK